MFDPEKLMFIIIAFLVVIIGFAFGSSFKGIYYPIAMLFVLIAAIFVLVMGFADTIFFPLLMSAIGMRFQIADGYWMSREQNSVIKNVNGLYYATGYISANLFQYTFKLEMPLEEEESKMEQAPSNWERAVATLRFPWKYNVISAGLDVQDIRSELEGKRSFQEFQLARLMQSSNPSATAMQDIQREINIIQTKMDRISGGEKPIATLMYIETTSVGVSEKAAADSLNNQASSISTALGGFDVQLDRIKGRELLVLFKSNFAIPQSIGELNDTFDKMA